MPNEWLLKKKKKREKRPRKCGWKKKKNEKKNPKNDAQYEHLIFISETFELGTDACFLLYYFVEIVLLKIL